MESAQLASWNAGVPDSVRGLPCERRRRRYYGPLDGTMFLLPTGTDGETVSLAAAILAS
jgi:hypothetical protein